MYLTSPECNSSGVLSADEIALTAKVIAPLIGCAVPTVYKMAAAAQIPYVSVGVRRRGRRFYLSAVRAALEGKECIAVGAK